jgi:predicted ATPase
LQIADCGLRIAECGVQIANRKPVLSAAEGSQTCPERSRRIADTETPEDCFQRAIAVARRQGAKSWELRATVSLARLWQQQGRGAEARQMLADVYGWFTEGFDMPDLRDARLLLADLAPGA